MQVTVKFTLSFIFSTMAIKLTYFDVTALGEPIRFILAYGGMDFTDERLTSEEFAPRKESEFINVTKY
jgi:hypothetical protein